MFKATRVLVSLLILFLAMDALAQTRIAHISDIHLGASTAPNVRGRLLAIVEDLNERHPDAVFVTGDIAEIPANWIEVRQILSAVTSPVYYVPGNHDTNGPDIALYRSVFGRDYYSVEVNEVIVFALNSQLLGNFNNLRAEIPPPMDPAAEVEGEKMLQWLAQQPAPGEKIAIAIQHVPLFFSERLPERRPYWVISEPYRSREVTELQRLRVQHVLAGHWHMQDVEDEPLIQHIAPSVAWPLFKSQPGYSLHTILKDGSLHSERIAPSADLSIKMTAPASVGTGDTLTYALTVKNQGPRAASGVVVTDTLPGGHRFVASTTSQGACTGSTPVVCEIGSLAASASAQVSVALETNSAGAITNSAAVAANQYDFEQANDSALRHTSIELRDFLLQISPASASAKAGSPATYTVTVVPTAAGFEKEISLGCSGIGAVMSCSFSPAQLVPGKQQRNSVLTVSVATAAQIAQRSSFSVESLIALLALTCASVVLSSKIRTRLKTWLALLFLLAIGCGGGEDAKQSTERAGTAVTITVTGSAGSIQRKATTTLIVQ